MKRIEIDYRGLADSIEEWIRKVVSEASVSGVVVGLSGGLDSAVCAALCAENPRIGECTWIDNVLREYAIGYG